MARILFVEDSRLFADAVLLFLNEHNVIHVSTLSAAKGAIDEGSFDLLITDTQFPDHAGGEVNPCAGFDLADYLQKKGCRVPVIACSAELDVGVTWLMREVPFVAKGNLAQRLFCEIARVLAPCPQPSSERRRQRAPAHA